MESVLNGPEFEFWAILFAAAIAAIIALVTIAKTRIIAKKRAALDFITGPWENNKGNEIKFLKMAEKGELLKIMEAGQEEIGLNIQAYLNTFELLSILIKWNVVDENICKAMIGDKLVKHWQKAFPLISAIRTTEGDDEFFEHFEDLASRSKDSPLIKQDFWLIALLKEIPRV